MHLLLLEVVHDPQHVGGEVVELERSGVVVRGAVPARVPGRRLEARGEDRQLLAPVVPVAADAVQEQDQRAGAVHVERDARGGSFVVVRRRRREQSLCQVYGWFHGFLGAVRPVTGFESIL